MKHLTKLILIAMIGILSLMLVTGCSDDDSSTNAVTAGDLSSPSYASGRGQADARLDDMFTSLSRGMGNLGGWNPPPLRAEPVDSSDSGYDSETGWWYNYNLYEYEDAIIWESDSVRFTTAGEFTEEPDSTTDKMEFKYYDGLTGTLYIPDSTFEDSIAIDLDGYFWNAWAFSDLQSDTLTINGYGGEDFDMTFDGEEYSETFTETYSNVKIFIENVYPHAGTISTTMNIYALYGGEFGQLTFTLTVTFYDLYYHVYMTDGSYYWEWDEEWPEG
ncbi:MAG: hypothetical protein GY855_04455 [candidate division Zixibacteria bacterium]|nr:hypothetical protein [candidate division Zixibacteria bacterium]